MKKVLLMKKSLFVIAVIAGVFFNSCIIEDGHRHWGWHHHHEHRY